jgi:hypothetical protein
MIKSVIELLVDNKSDAIKLRLSRLPVRRMSNEALSADICFDAIM